ncbi:MAG: prolyl oligopeptidase family serine peptidase [Actinobacteria bacterium]|nr:prolyl oligopeptidase family serine peptidase [Actinomycetota bacterium]
MSVAVIVSMLFACIAGCGKKAPVPATGGITARELVEPGALAGPGPSILGWSPRGAVLAYAAPGEGGGADVLWTYDASTGERSVLFDPAGQPDNIDVSSAQWSPAGDAMLLAGDTSLWLLQTESGELRRLVEAGASATAMMFDPSGTRVSYVQRNDLHYVDIADGRMRRVTADGSDAVFNGCLDWVYNEELATRAAQPGYAWSPDGRWLLYMRLDDSGVQNDPVTDYRTVPPTVSYTRYPTAGSPNPAVSMHALAPDAGAQALDIPLPPDAEYVLPFYAWTPDSGEAFFITVSRDHRTLRLNAWSPAGGAVRTVIEETDPHWINESYYAAPSFLPDGRRFLWLSERDGFMHLYLYSLQGEELAQLTQGDWLIETTAFNLLTPGRPVHVDPQGSHAYFTATADGPLERQAYRLDLAGGGLERISTQAGFHAVALSGDGEYLVDQFSNVDTPPVTAILDAQGREVEELGRCAGPSLELPRVSREFLTVQAHDGTELHAQMVKPEGFDPDRKYGVVVHWYGGPALQLVSNRYGTTNIFNHIERDVLYTQAGFIVWRLDSRGSFGRGHAFEVPICGQFGPAALDDQLAGVEYLKTLPYVDPERIGTDGKSFGGFLTLYALIHAPEVFRCGVAGSGPTDWSYYDTIYTERYMGTPVENPAGYAAAELVSRASGIGAEPLIIHGLADTNVHLQNSVNFIQALERADKPFSFVPLPNEDHHYEGDGLATALSHSVAYFLRQMGE